ncbi:MAG: MBL fold metallo-hydrolase [bacterium]|nr:MBL fold metallo-hydrolase [bacterium]
MKVLFCGAARSVSGSLHLVDTRDGRWMLDCGLFQGRRQDMYTRNAALPVRPDSLSGVLLSHAHVDHSGRLPRLVHLGFRGPIYATRATIDFCSLLLADSAYVLRTQTAQINQRRLERGLPPLPDLYTDDDVRQTLALMQPVKWYEELVLGPHLRASFIPAGHIPGASSILLRELSTHGSCSLVYSGDVGRTNDWIMPDPAIPSGADFAILESTYGDCEHRPYLYARSELARNLRSTLAAGGVVVIPAYSVGRTQRLVYELRDLISSGELPNIPVYVDSPLSVEASRAFMRHPDVLHMPDGPDRTFARLQAVHVVSSEESRALRSQPGPFIVLTASGMCEAGRVLHHLKRNLPDPNSRVVFVGFCAEDTLGRLLLNKQPSVRINGEVVPVHAHIDNYDTFSAHADQRGLAQWIQAQPSLRAIFLVHGEEPQAFALAEHLESLTAREVIVPFANEAFSLSPTGVRPLEPNEYPPT